MSCAPMRSSNNFNVCCTAQVFLSTKLTSSDVRDWSAYVEADMPAISADFRK
jgi:hypothetical protein